MTIMTRRFFFGLCLATVAACGGGGSGTAFVSPAPQQAPAPGAFATTLAVSDANGLPATQFAAGEAVTFTVTLQNLSGRTLTLPFNDSQRYDIFVRVAGSDDVVWQWSQGQGFLQVIGSETFAPGEQVSYTETWDQLADSGLAVAAGMYDVTGTITVSGTDAADFVSLPLAIEIL